MYDASICSPDTLMLQYTLFLKDWIGAHGYSAAGEDMFHQYTPSVGLASGSHNLSFTSFGSAPNTGQEGASRHTIDLSLLNIPPMLLLQAIS